MVSSKFHLQKSYCSSKREGLISTASLSWGFNASIVCSSMEKKVATHSSILAWKIPWTDDPGRLQSMGSQRVRHDWVTSLHYSMYRVYLYLYIGYLFSCIFQLVLYIFSLSIREWFYKFLLFLKVCISFMGFPGGSVVKTPPASTGDAGNVGSLLGLGRSPGEGNGNSLQYSCLENTMVRWRLWATVHGVAKSQIKLSNWACISLIRTEGKHYMMS